MDKRLISVLGGLALLSPASAFAAGPATNTATADVPVIGRVASLCVLGTPSSSEINLGQMATTSGARVGRIATLTAAPVAIDGSFCNFGGTRLTVDASAMANLDDGGAAPQANFARAVNYTATVGSWAATDAAVTTAAATDGSSANASGFGGTLGVPKLASLSLTVSNFAVPSDALLVAGNYRGLVRITLGPAE